MEECKFFVVVVSDGVEVFFFLCNVLLGIGGCLYGVVCIYDNLLDEDFIIDMLSGYENMFVIIGFSGYGFKFVLVLGEIVVDFVLGKIFFFDLMLFWFFCFS